MKNEFEYFESARLREKYCRIKHRSGLEILVSPKKTATLCAFIGAKFGSLDDRYTSDGSEIKLPDGTAHFLEHKLFACEDGTSSDEIFAALGAESNAYTNYSSTCYYFCATKKYRECLAELLRFVTHPYFTEENVEKERGIIAEEIAMYRDDPDDAAMQSALRAMYHKNPIRKSICGSANSISKITPDLLYRVYHDKYNLNNMTLTVCGDVTPEEVAKVADRELPETSPAYTAFTVKQREPDGVVTGYAEKRMRVARPVFFIGFKNRPLETKEERFRRGLAMSVLDNMLFSGTGEFYNGLMKEGLITPAFTFGYSTGNLYALNYFSGNSDDPGKVYDRILEKTSDAASGLDENDFIRCKKASYAGYLKLFDSSADIADEILMTSAATGTDPYAVPEMLENITFDEIKLLAENAFSRDDRVMSVVLPL